MITIIKNDGGDENKILVSKGAYESFYKRLGYSIVEEKKKEVAVEKAVTSKEKEKEEKPKEETKVSKNKKLSD